MHALIESTCKGSFNLQVRVLQFKVKKPGDTITVPGRLYPDKAAEERLISFMRRFQAAKRSAYQALRRGEEPGEIVKDLYRKFFPNARWCQWAVEDAKATIESQKEQIKMYVSDLEAKIEKFGRETQEHQKQASPPGHLCQTQ